MDGLRNLAESVSRWLDGVAASIVSAFGWFLSPRIVRVVEEPDGSAFTLQMPKDAASRGERLRLADGGFAGPLPVGMLKAVRGNRVEIVLNPSRFVFKQLELPRRAVEFLDGIIRAQIDRLTPWSAADAVFGWGRPADVAGEHISIMIAATARAMVRPLLQAVSDLGAGSIAIFTVPTEGAAASIKVYDQAAGGSLDAGRMRRAVSVVLLVAMAAAALAFGADVWIGGEFDARQLDATQRIEARRTLLRGNQSAAARSATAELDRRKQETPATVIVLEALSAVLPDHTYVTELRVEGNKLQIIGLTKDAPGLIRLIEQSPHFSKATFFAPTTRSPSDPGDRFHIEARIEPVNEPRT
jgi:general secretion pathway protein L